MPFLFHSLLLYDSPIILYFPPDDTCNLPGWSPHEPSISISWYTHPLRIRNLRAFKLTSGAPGFTATGSGRKHPQ